MDKSVIFALNSLDKRPKTYDVGGWYSLAKDLGITDKLDPSDEALPKSKREMEKVSSVYLDELNNERSKTAVCVLDANKYVQLPIEKRESEMASWRLTMESFYFPTYVLTLNKLTKDFLRTNFRFKYADDGSPIVFRRVMGVEGTLWEEAPDSGKPFSTLQGKLRLDLEKTLVATGPAKEVDVFYSKNGQVDYMTNVPFYKLYVKHRSEFIANIKGNEESVSAVIGEFDEYIANLKRQHNEGPNKWEVQKGMLDLNEMLSTMDESINTFDFIYDQNFEPVDLTNDKSVDAFAYFDLNTLKEGETPNFDGFLDAIVPECREMFMAAVFATVFALSLLNQYIWIHGEGGDGKSSFLNALMKFLGGRLCCSLGQTLNSDFGLENAVGKRMVILSDVKTGLSVKSQLIHNLTGHDPVSINRKNKPIITKELQPIVWIAANEAPDVNFDARNEARRCLYIKMQEPSVEVQKKFYFLNEDGSFATDAEGRKINNGYDLTGGLLKEMPAILYKCKQAFERVCPAPYSVIRPTSAAISLAEENCIDLDVDVWRTYIDETFDFTDPESRMLHTEIYEALEETKQMHSDRTKLTNFAKRDIRRLLTVAYKCGRKNIHNVKYLTGIKRKNAT